MKSLSIDLIRTDGGTQTRAALNKDAVADYAQAWLDDAEFPPLDVFYDSIDYWLADGFHRYHGAKQAERSSVPCNVHQGNKRDALEFALKANATNGLRRTNKDKRKAVEIALSDALWSEFSSASIGEMCGVSHQFVEKIRNQSVTVTDCGGKSGGLREAGGKPGKTGKPRTGTDGKKYPAPESSSSALEPEQESSEIDEVELVEEPIELTTAEFMAEWNTTINSGCRSISTVAKEVVEELQHMEGRELLDKTSVGIFIDQLKAALQMLRCRKGFKECPHCEGERCKRCDGLGWMAKSKWNSTPRN